MESKSNSGLGSFSTVLFIVFLVLKLTNVIKWSWWWVTAPLWVGTSLVIIMYLGLYMWVYSHRDEVGKIREALKNNQRKSKFQRWLDQQEKTK